jgi:hypothetical protein
MINALQKMLIRMRAGAAFLFAFLLSIISLPGFGNAQIKAIDCAKLPFISSVPVTECSVEESEKKSFEVFRANFHNPDSAVSIVLYRTMNRGGFAVTTPESAILGMAPGASWQRPWAYKNFLSQAPARSEIRDGKYHSFPAALVKPLQGQPTTCAQYFKFSNEKYFFSGLFCTDGTEVPEAAIDVIVDSLKLK